MRCLAVDMSRRLFQDQVRLVYDLHIGLDSLIPRDKKIIDAVDVETPPWRRESTGLWIDIPKNILDLMMNSGMNPAEGIHAAEHAFLNQFALANDLGTECKVAEKEYKSTETNRKRPAR